MTDLIEHIRNGGKVQTANLHMLSKTQVIGNHIFAFIEGYGQPGLWSADGEPLSPLAVGFTLVPIHDKPVRREWFVQPDANLAYGTLEGFPDEVAKSFVQVREVLPGDVDPDAAKELMRATRHLIEQYQDGRPTPPSIRDLERAFVNAVNKEGE